MRLLVTGSRTWTDPDSIYRILYREVVEPYWRRNYGNDSAFVDWVPPADFVLVHGACPTGVDAILDDLALTYGVRIERHPAAWEMQGKRAGYLRNKYMVELGADLCLAFIRDHSRGATRCADMAEAAGIPTKRFYWEEWTHD